MFGPFYELFPKIGMKETRSIHMFNDTDIPSGEYAIINSYCTDKVCDCRRAFLNVHLVDENGLSRQPLALLAFKGPALDKMQPQSVHANGFLKIIKDTLKNDIDYANRIKRHYAYYKQKKGMRLPPELNKLVKGLDSCPCGSGKLLRLCCLKKKRSLRRRR